jgi:hypothetical protein
MDDARARAEQLLADPGLVDAALARSAVVGAAIPIVGPGGAGRPERWFVPVVAGNELVGFFVLGLDLTSHRWSTFPRRPPAATWLDPDVIGAAARAAAGGDEPSGPPVLSYDGAPERLAWAVPVGDRTVFVAGDATWIA